MKKAMQIIVVLLLMAAIVAGCIFAYSKFTSKDVEENKGDETATQETKKEPVSTEPLFSKENYPKFDASTATQPLTNAFYENFTGEVANEEEFNYTKTHQAYVKLINDEVDFIIVTQPSEEELALAKEKGIELEVIPVVNEGFVFYVNGENEVKDLTLEQIQKIYAGEITNWSEVGGADAEIVPYQRPVNSGSQTGMLSLVMKDLKMSEPKTENIVETMSQIINLVSDYDNGLNSIGYSYYYYATTMYDEIDSEVAQGIRLLGVNGVQPTNETIQNGTYPIQTKYYIVINKAEPENSDTRKAVEAMLSERGQQVAEEAGYVRVK